MKMKILIPLLFLMSGALHAEESLGTLVCRGPLNYETDFWMYREDAAFLTVRFYADRSLGRDLEKGHCYFRKGGGFTAGVNVGQAFIDLRKVYGGTFLYRNHWESNGSNSNVLFFSHDNREIQLFNKLHGKSATPAFNNIVFTISRMLIPEINRFEVAKIE